MIMIMIILGWGLSIKTSIVQCIYILLSFPSQFIRDLCSSSQRNPVIEFFTLLTKLIKFI